MEVTDLCRLDLIGRCLFLILADMWLHVSGCVSLKLLLLGFIMIGLLWGGGDEIGAWNMVCVCVCACVLSRLCVCALVRMFWASGSEQQLFS